MAPKVTKLFIAGLEFLTHALVSPLGQHLWPKDGRTCDPRIFGQKKEKNTARKRQMSPVLPGCKGSSLGVDSDCLMLLLGFGSDHFLWFTLWPTSAVARVMEPTSIMGFGRQYTIHCAWKTKIYKLNMSDFVLY